MLEVRHDEFAQGAVDRFAEAEAAVIGFGDGSPMAMLLENGEDVVVVADRFEIEEQGRKALDTESRGTEQSALETMGYVIAQYAARRTNGVAIRLLVVGDFSVEEALDSLGGFERLENAGFAGI